MTTLNNLGPDFLIHVLGNELGDREIAVLCNVGMGEQIMN